MTKTARIYAKNRVPTTAQTSDAISRMPIPSTKEDDGSTGMPLQGVFPVDVNTDPMTYTMPVTLQSAAGTKVAVNTFTPTGSLGSGAPLLETIGPLALTNIANGNWEQLRTPSTFKTGSANLINSTALWTPAGGKKFRIMGFNVLIPSTATAAGGITVTLKDAAATVFTLFIMGTTTQAVNYQTTLAGNGYLSSAADNVLNIDNTAAFTAGSVTVNVWGTEE